VEEPGTMNTERRTDTEKVSDTLAAGIKATGGEGEGDDLTPTPEQDIQLYRARLESEGHRTVAAKHYRSVLNRVANSVGAVPIALGEMGVEHIAEGAESLSRHARRLTEANDFLTADRTGMAVWAASHEHHEEHHRREEELEAEIEGLRAERDAFRSLCLSLSECYRPQYILGSHTWPGYERAEALMREHLGLPALPADTLADMPASGGEGEDQAP
jgi:hypothetical protein